jgi:prepilin-type N-terminal cleavage/methylation domain-containing protein
MRRVVAGFSLLEVLVAMTIFAIVSLAVAKLMVEATAIVSENAAASQAIAFAQEVMEHLRTAEFEDMESGGDTYVDDKGRQFNAAWTVAKGSPQVYVNSVTVEVSWQEKGETKYYTLKNVFTDVTY